MKLIKAIIQPEKLSEVRDALEKTAAPWCHDQRHSGPGPPEEAIVQVWRGEKFSTDLLPKVSLELVVKDSDVESIVKTIIESARTGEYGDGKIFISTVDQAIRIRTGESGDVAI
jgi:nitrogen regulatory protein P-II 1